MLIGDDLTDVKVNSTKFRRIQKLFGNKDIISVAKLGRAFAPYTVTAGERCADAYWCEADGVLYLAVFNFENQKADRTFDLSALVDKLPTDAVAKELWSGKNADLNGMTLACTVKGQDAALFRIGSPVEEENTDAPTDENQQIDSPVTLPAPNQPNKLLMPLLIGGIGLVAIAAVSAGVVLFVKRKRNRP